MLPLKHVRPHAEEHRSAGDTCAHELEGLRCVSKHEGERNGSSSSFETRVRPCEFVERLRHARSSGWGRGGL